MRVSKLIKSTEFDRTNRLPRIGSMDRDFDELVSTFDDKSLRALSRSLYQSNPILRSCIDQKASYAIGDAGAFKSRSRDRGWAVEADSLIRDWGKVAEVRGSMDINSVLYLVSTLIDIDGDCFILLTKTRDGQPKIQLLEAHCIGSRQDAPVAYGNTTYLMEHKGCIYYKDTKKIAKYRILGNDVSSDTIVDAASIIHFKEPSLSLRGIPIASNCIDTLYDIRKSQELILIQQRIAASIALIETNPTGVVDSYGLNGANLGGGLQQELISDEGGEIRYFKGNTGSSLTTLKNDNPTDQWQAYQDTITNQCVLGLSWNRAMLGMGDASGTSNRIALQICAKATQDRQNLIFTLFNRAYLYALACFDKLGWTKLPDDFDNFRITKPRSISIDLFRDSKAEKEELEDGRKNLSQILDLESRDLEDHLYQRYEEEAIRIKIKGEIETKYGVSIPDPYARLINPAQFNTLTPENK